MKRIQLNLKLDFVNNPKMNNFLIFKTIIEQKVTINRSIMKIMNKFNHSSARSNKNKSIRLSKRKRKHT